MKTDREFLEGVYEKVSHMREQPDLPQEAPLPENKPKRAFLGDAGNFLCGSGDCADRYSRIFDWLQPVCAVGGADSKASALFCVRNPGRGKSDPESFGGFAL